PPRTAPTPQETPRSQVEATGKRPRSLTREGPRKKGPGVPTTHPDGSAATPQGGTTATPPPETTPSEHRPVCLMPMRAPAQAVDFPPLLKFDPTDFTGLPTSKAENPHLTRTRRGPTPLLPKQTTRIYTDSEFPHTHIPS
ncbi:hypothetical protein BD311DRAFT_599371, partial [Dichomitus squalens]